MPTPVTSDEESEEDFSDSNDENEDEEEQVNLAEILKPLSHHWHCHLPN